MGPTWAQLELLCKAYDKKDKRLVAIKKLPELFEDLVDCKRILREVLRDLGGGESECGWGSSFS